MLKPIFNLLKSLAFLCLLFQCVFLKRPWSKEVSHMITWESFPMIIMHLSGKEGRMNICPAFLVSHYWAEYYNYLIVLDSSSKPCKAGHSLFPLLQLRKFCEGKGSGSSSSCGTWPVVGLCNIFIEWMNKWMRKLSLSDLAQGHSVYQWAKPHLNPGVSVSKDDCFQSLFLIILELNKMLLWTPFGLILQPCAVGHTVPFSFPEAGHEAQKNQETCPITQVIEGKFNTPFQAFWPPFQCSSSYIRDILKVTGDFPGSEWRPTWRARGRCFTAFSLGSSCQSLS